ncbi:NAD(P)-dependent dehydrogenase (short-subunit alcohol dehydrogenase family) [Rhizobium sp. PP-F2F-G38]|nr:NAD(P)-dependent dehydrogenase (short-subunit alcohol dehydrogenase family) [Rhizobium sp. PP-WC-1G-195]PYE99683.1 NAD(P)-dependent dehydrogenase (short-subunit alcohol dehydrogenase family) [Rhizobium sp. PP-F2F-G38]
MYALREGVDSMPGPSATFPDLADRGVLITGGASGIGAALVEGFVRQGARVAYIDINADTAAEVSARLKDVGPHAPLFIEADLRDIAGIPALVDRAAAALGGLKVLVNNAARDDRQVFGAISEADWDENLGINLKPVFFMSQAAAPYLKASNGSSLSGGSIVNFSSIAYLLNMGEVPAYATAKAGIVGLTKSLAGALGPSGVRVNALLPGMVVTERQKALWLTEDSIEAMRRRQRIPETLYADDLVGPCLFLASDCSARMTAQTMIIDGGVL